MLAADVSGREKETAHELGTRVVPFTVDVTDEAEVEAMFAAAVDAFGRVDAVLNVAGIAARGPLADITLDEYDRIMAVDLKGVMLGTKHGIKAMLPTGGGVDPQLVVDRRDERLRSADERLLGGEGRRHLVHEGGGHRVRRARASARTRSAPGSSRPRCRAVRARRSGSRSSCRGHA